MENKLLLLTLGILLISLTSAMYAGSNYSFIIDTTDKLFWDVEGNSSNMEGFSVYQEIEDSKSIITFSAVENMKPDNFTIILYLNKSTEIIKEIYVYSGGGTRTKYIKEKEYIEVPNYITEYIEKTDDIVEEEEEITEEETKNNWLIIILFVLVLFMIILLVYILYKKKKDRIERRLKNEKIIKKES